MEQLSTRKNIFGLTFNQLQNGLQHHGFPKFRAKQIWDWVYVKGICKPEEMTNLSKTDREKLAEVIDFTLPEITTQQLATDGVAKWLFKMVDGHEIEVVFIPEGKRGTLCISSQVGCTLSCRFCHTGTQGLSRNLEAQEIVGQVYLAKRQLEDFGGENEKRKLSNIVFMGMGEPLYNMDNVEQTCKILMDEKGLAFGSRKITISTSGMVDNLPRVEALGVNLAISIHAADTETRKKIMPITNKWSAEILYDALRNFNLKERRRITWEYVMLDGVNDSPAHAKALLNKIQGIPSFVNIIPFNEWPGSPYKATPAKQIEKFADVFKKAGVACNVRRARGEDILAACGQLRGETSKFNTVSLEFPTVVMQYGNEKQKAKVQIEHDT